MMEAARQLQNPEQHHPHLQRAKSWEQTGLWLLSTASHRLAELIEQAEERHDLDLSCKRIFAEGVWGEPGGSGLYQVGVLHFELQVPRALAESAALLLDDLTSRYQELFSSHGFVLRGRLLVA